MLKTAWSFLVRDFLITTSYRAGFAIQVVGILFGVAVFHFMSTTVGATSDVLKPYGGNLFAFLIIGVAFVDYVTNSLQTFASSIREGQMVGTLEMLLVSPVPTPVIIVSSSLWSYVFSSFRFSLFVGGGALFFDLSLAGANIGGALCALVLSILYLMGLGVIGAGLVLVIKQEKAFTSIMMLLTVLLGGVAYPVEVLPGWLRGAAEVLPFTHSIKTLRQAMLMNYSWAQLSPELLILTLYAVILLPLGLFFFTLCLQRVKMNGSLSHY